MNRHRFRALVTPEVITEAAAPASAAAGFMICPVSLQPGWAGAGVLPPWQQVYQMAFEQARAALQRADWLSRLLPSPN